MKKLACNILGIGLAACAACAMADTSHTTQYQAESAGIASGNDGRTYSYVVYGTADDSVPVVSDSTDVNSEGRGLMPAVTSDSQAEIVPRGANAWRYEHAAADNVSVGHPDVNEVQGRA
ncbi:MAG TPA: hypothetical protein VHB46_02130 [Burkholderiales bacterium]|nr:hypothetical protein [Burkholderiales bacterium]